MPKLEFTNAALRDYKKLASAMIDRINRSIDGLETNPLPPGHRKFTAEETLYRVRVGDYRIIYDYHDGSDTLTVTRIRHRREVYR
ncbi:MAG TPA: type II toxin-antitoxin system RelE/ParE family toxin [Bacteroidetes bacterium]|nr:plasmid stabilization system protein [bacterium BMS3Bbin04]HDO64892.1 type II toxin-antitoxin system RelE/ParE family toxin [Bacteroidota bacterium]HEX04017.1 type II toxin-antitoxin system RelE/ParE family toxin [Bacteroidota bacterium]